jgi:MFS family permease
MTATTTAFGTAGPSPSNASLSGLDGVNFFIAGILAGFGPYVAAYLAQQKWTQENIGFVLTASALAGLLSQLPAGELLDTIRSKRALVVAGATMLAISAIVIAFAPTFPLVFTGLVLQGITGGFLGPAIAAISLGLVGHADLPQRLGRNQRFSSTGSLIAAALMGLIGYFLSYQAIFLTAAALTPPLFVALARIHATDIHFGRACGAPHHHTSDRLARVSRGSLWKNSGLLTFATCLFLFQLANASVLPLVVEALAYQEAEHSSLTISVLIIPAADHRCPHGSLGRTTGKKLGSPAASPHRVRRSANPRAAVRFRHQWAAGCWFSGARWHQWSGAGRADGAGHCRCHKRHRPLQLGPRHRWNGVWNRRFA